MLISETEQTEQLRPKQHGRKTSYLANFEVMDPPTHPGMFASALHSESGMKRGPKSVNSCECPKCRTRSCKGLQFRRQLVGRYVSST